MGSILNSVKKQLGIMEEYTHFDDVLIIHINSVLMILTQLGVGPEEGFIIKDATTTWTEYIPDVIKCQAVKSYVYLKVRLLFDPPSSSALIESMNRLISELEYRLNIEAEYQSGGEEV